MGLSTEDGREIRDKILAASDKKFITKTRLNKLAKEIDLIAFSDISNYGTVAKEIFGDQFDSLRKAGLTRAIKKIKRKRTLRPAKGDNGEEIIDEYVEIELHDKMQGIGETIEMMRLKTPKKLELSGSNGKPIEVQLVDFSSVPLVKK